MKIDDWAATPDLNEIYREIRALGLETNLAELEAFGFTILENGLTPELTAQLRKAILVAAESFTGRRLDLEHETGHEGLTFVPFLLFKDPIFKRVLLSPGPLALITYLLGKHCVLSSLGCHLKGPGGRGLLLHSDQANGLPQPFPAASQVANCNYALTDYSEENGALAMVPGSHRHLRQPTPAEVHLEGPRRNPGVIAVEVPAGSAILWHGATWHGSFPRKQPGLRINLSSYFCRPHLMPQESYRDSIPEGFLDGEDPRLARLLGADLAYGWKDEGLTRPLAPQHTWHA